MVRKTNPLPALHPRPWRYIDHTIDDQPYHMVVDADDIAIYVEPQSDNPVHCVLEQQCLRQAVDWINDVSIPSPFGRPLPSPR